MSGGYLLDTSVLSLLAPGRPALPDDLAAALRRHSDRLFLPTIALAEIREGICKLRRKGSASRAGLLDAWIGALRRDFGQRVLAFDADAAEAAGEIADHAVGIGRHPGFADVAIAGIAKARGLSVLTENQRHFEPLGIPAFDMAGLARQ